MDDLRSLRGALPGGPRGLRRARRRYRREQERKSACLSVPGAKEVLDEGLWNRNGILCKTEPVRLNTRQRPLPFYIACASTYYIRMIPLASRPYLCQSELFLSRHFGCKVAARKKTRKNNKCDVLDGGRQGKWMCAKRVNIAQ